MSPIKDIILKEMLKENPELKLSNIQVLREWCEKQYHLPKIEDVEIAKFLCRKHYRIEATKRLIDNYYTIRTHVPEIFRNRDPLLNKGLQQSFAVTVFLPLAGKTKEEHSILYSSFLDHDASNFIFNDTVTSLFMTVDLWYATNAVPSKDCIYIVNCKGASFAHTIRISPVALTKCISYVSKALPLRLKEIHLINVTPIVEMFINTNKPFLSKKLFNKIHLHVSFETIPKHIRMEDLPNEAGGKAGDIHDLAQMQKRKLEENREWFLTEEATKRVDETKRLGESKTDSDLFGIEGTFKKLEID